MAQCLRQQMGHAASDKMSQRHFGEKTDQVVGGHHHVAVKHPLKSATHGVAMDRAHHHFVAKHDVAGDLLDAITMLGNGSSALCLLFKLLQVVTRTKRPARPGQHNGTRCRVILGSDKGVVQIDQQLATNRVEALGTIECHNTHRTLCTELCVLHGVSSTLRTRFTGSGRQPTTQADFSRSHFWAPLNSCCKRNFSTLSVGVFGRSGIKRR